MTLVVNPATSRLASALNRAGLASVNRLAKRLIWKLAGNRVTIAVDGLTLSGPAESWSILQAVQRGAFEPFEVAMFTSSLQAGMVVLDIGANIGWYTVLAAREVGPQGHVYAFEPDPRTRSSLAHNVRANGFGNVTIVPMAASDTSGIQTLYQSRHAVWSGLSPSWRESSIVGIVSVDAARVDDVLGEQSVDVIKMDIEGHEPAALRGMTSTLVRNPGVELFLEFNPGALRAAGVNPESFASTLGEAFDAVSSIDERTASLRPFSPERRQRSCNVVCRGYKGIVI